MKNKTKKGPGIFAARWNSRQYLEVSHEKSLVKFALNRGSRRLQLSCAGKVEMSVVVERAMHHGLRGGGTIFVIQH